MSGNRLLRGPHKIILRPIYTHTAAIKSSVLVVDGRRGLFNNIRAACAPHVQDKFLIYTLPMKTYNIPRPSRPFIRSSSTPYPIYKLQDEQQRGGLCWWSMARHAGGMESLIKFRCSVGILRRHQDTHPPIHPRSDEWWRCTVGRAWRIRTIKSSYPPTTPESTKKFSGEKCDKGRPLNK